MFNLLVIVGIALALAIPFIIIIRLLGLDSSEARIVNYLQDVYWEYVSGEKGRDDARHT